MMRKALGLLLAVLPAFAQPPAALEGDWRGTLSAGGGSLRLALHIEKASDGLYLGKLDSLDQGSVLPIDTIDRKGDQVNFAIKAVNGTFKGTLAGEKLKGTWNQGRPLPLEFTRVPAGEATQPAAPPRLTAAQMQAFGVPLDLSVPVPPTPITLDGKTTLFYELRIVNLGSGTVDLSRLEILGDGKTLAAWEAQQLNGVLFRMDVKEGTDFRSLPPGMWAMAFLSVSLEPDAAVPVKMTHRITVEGLSVEGGPTAPSPVKPLVLGPPLHGGDWLAANGPSNTSIHRRAAIPVDGRLHIAQRFAIDWLRFSADHKTYTGDPKNNRNYHAYGCEVLAVADGVVIEVKDGIPENVPGITSRAVPITLETVGGNHVVLDLGGGRYAFYAHLQPGRLRVHTGDRVKRGQVLGLLGNSGNSTEPHLHFHVSDGPSPLGSEGVPYILESLGAMPAQNATVKFDSQ